MSLNIVVCVKFAPDAADIEVKSDGSISLERAEWGIGSFDLQAIEAAVQLAEVTQGKVIALSAGPARINNSKLKKDLLSRGPDELVLVADDALTGADTAVTAKVLAAAIKKVNSVDLILCGEGSADLYFQQVGLQVGERIGIPTLNAVNKIELQGDHLLVERSLEDEIEVLKVPLPAALSVTTDIHQARLPTMKEILKAGKKPVQEWSLVDLGLSVLANKVEILRTQAPPRVERKNILINGLTEEAARELVGYLNKEGIL
jgi:electron transfer flavoprotein beta subunit